MYRLLRRYTLPVHNIQLPSGQININQNSKVCSFCSFYHLKPFKPRSCLSVYRKDLLPDCSYSAIRHQTTSPSTAIMDEITPKKMKRQNKMYAELLEVTGETTTNKKAKIKKLNATRVSEFANEPEISLDQLHKIGKKSKRAAAGTPEHIEQTESKDFPISETAEEINLLASTNSSNVDCRVMDKDMLHEDLMVLTPDQSMIIKNASVLNTLEEYQEDIADENSLESMGSFVTPSEKMEEQKTKSIMKKVCKNKKTIIENEELYMHHKQESLQRNLQSYLEVCINSGMIVQGYCTLMYYRNQGKRLKSIPKVVDINLYNTILHGFASVGNLDKVKEVLKILAEDSIRPVPQTYAAIFECVSRIKTTKDYRGYLSAVASEMTANDISFNDILNKSVFINDQREMVDQGIRLLDPDFQVSYTQLNTSYTNHLLHKITNTPGTLIAPVEGLFTKSEFAERGREQMKLEAKGKVTVKSIAAIGEITPLILHCRDKITETEGMWNKVIREALERDIAVLRLRNKESNHFHKTINIYPYLMVLNSEHYIDAISSEIRRLATGSETFSPSLNSLARQLGTDIFNRYTIETKKANGVCDKVEKIYEQYCDRYLDGYKDMNTRTIWQNLLHEQRHNGPTADLQIKPWPPYMLLSIGKFLYNIILRDIKIDINSIKMNSSSPRYLPAFYAVFRNNRQIITQEIKPHPTLSRIYRDAQLETLTFESTLLPLLSPPIPWYSIHNGGYLITNSKIIRLPYQANQQWKRLEEVPKQQLYPILDSLNQLGSIPWKVNNPVLDIALQIFQTGGSKNLDIPEPPSHAASFVPISINASKEERNRAVKVRLKEKKQKADMYSLWCDALYRLSLATHFRNEVFWLPHSMDFRGRVYPIPPHLNHLGSDLARSLMVFALGKPLGPDGLDWLKIHIINLTGLKKREPNSERLKYANELLPKILDSAENPLDGEKWWQESEEPWQTLAACFEIAKAIKSPNPVEYVSHFPIHQDGSCNGLQHYAALGRDQHGAESVNLHPFPKPQDVYSSIAALVERERKNDAAGGLQIAVMLEGLIKRKVIKQTVMTTVYGVTRFGARLQIARQLREIEFPDEFLWQGSHYLVNKTFLSLREMFTSTKLIQDWLTDSARLVALVCGRNMEWVTPLGLPIVQPYNRNTQIFEGAKPTLCSASNFHDKPNVMKQKNAFPPNFIHSLDSCHMMLTSLHCEHAGLTFVSVHDCFWTHACTVPQMNKICREEFVALHSEPILENLSKFLNDKFSFKESDLDDDGSPADLTKRKLNNILTQVPEQGAFDLKSVLKSVYFFS